MFGMGTNRLRHACVTSFTGLPTVHGTPKDMHLHIPAKYITKVNNLIGVTEQPLKLQCFILRLIMYRLKLSAESNMIVPVG